MLSYRPGSPVDRADGTTQPLWTRDVRDYGGEVREDGPSFVEAFQYPGEDPHRGAGRAGGREHREGSHRGDVEGSLARAMLEGPSCVCTACLPSVGIHIDFFVCLTRVRI